MKKESAQKLKNRIEGSGIHKYYELTIEVDEFDTDEYSVDLVSRRPLSGQNVDEIASELNKMAKETDDKILDVDCSEWDSDDGSFGGNNYSYRGENDTYSKNYELRFSMI